MKGTLWMASAAVLLAASGASAQPPGFGQGHGHPVMDGLIHAVMRLELSDAQRSGIHRIMEDAGVRLLEIESADDEQMGFMEYFCSADFSGTGLMELLDGRLERMGRVHSVVSTALDEVHSLLTADQLDELTQMVEEHGRRPGERDHFMVPPGGDMAPPCPGMR